MNRGDVSGLCNVSIAATETMDSVAFGNYSSTVPLVAENTMSTPRTLYFGHLTPGVGGRLQADNGWHHIFTRNISNNGPPHRFKGSFTVTGSYAISGNVFGSDANDTLSIMAENVYGNAEMGNGHDRVFIGGDLVGVVSYVTGKLDLGTGHNLLYIKGVMPLGTVTTNEGKNLLIFGSDTTLGNLTGLAGTDNVVLCKTGTAGCNGLVQSGDTWFGKVAREVTY